LSTFNQLVAIALAVNDKLGATLPERFGRSRSETETLVSVRHCDTFTVGLLGEALGLTHSAAARVVGRLESGGRTVSQHYLKDRYPVSETIVFRTPDAGLASYP